jgi:hypothetical protein
MTTASPPRIVGMVEIHCTHTLTKGQRTGEICGRIIAIVPSLQQLNGVYIPSCKTCGHGTQF